MYRDLVGSLDELDAIARSDRARIQYPQLQRLARQMRERTLQAIEAIATEAATSHTVPTYVRPAPAERSPRRLLLENEKI